MACYHCIHWDFEDCGILIPCPEIKKPIEIIGVVIKPKAFLDPTDLNVEALFSEVNYERESDFYRHTYSLAKKGNLGFLTLWEFEMLGKIPVSDKRRRIKFDSFSSQKGVFCPLNWVQEARTCKKLYHRLYFQSLELTEDFLAKAALNSGNFAELEFDKGN